jgi:predicted ArsR family transcriptional regulator
VTRVDGAGIAVLGSLDDPVRRRLYQFVAERGEPVGRDEAAAAAGIGRPLAAYHLDRLVGLGLLTASYRRPSGRGGPGAGRPAKVYTRSPAEYTVTVPDREYELAAQLLAAAVEADGGGASRAALAEAARRLGADIGRRSAADGRGQAAALAALREYGFEPFRDAGGTIRLRNCPFRRLADRHPQVVCGMNLALIEGVAAGLASGDPGPAPLRVQLDPQPGCCCVAIHGDEAATRHDGSGVS